MGTAPLEESVREAARRALGALLVDVDVTSAHAVERGPVDVTRRGRKERLGVALPGELWQALKELGADQQQVSLVVDGHALHARPTADGRVLLYLAKRPLLDVRLASLVEEGVVPPEAAPAVLSLVHAGHGLVVVGPARAGAERLAIAVAREVSESAAVMALDEGLLADWLLPAPATGGGVVERAQACVALGAEVLVSLGLSLDEARALAGAELSAAVIAVVKAPNAAAYFAAFREQDDDNRAPAADALATQVCVVGRAPSGRPVLVEQHAPESAPLSLDPRAAKASERPPSESSSSSRSAPSWRAMEPNDIETAPVRAAPSRPAIDDSDLPPLPPLGSGPPAGWASSSPEDDPGWELGDRQRRGDDASELSPAHAAAPVAVPSKEGPSAFDGVMDDVKARPTFTPRPPPVHPQTRALRGDPFGGLTFEPPGGTPDDVAAPDDEDDG